jgi:hypothetical protein
VCQFAVDCGLFYRFSHSSVCFLVFPLISDILTINVLNFSLFFYHISFRLAHKTAFTLVSGVEIKMDNIVFADYYTDKLFDQISIGFALSCSTSTKEFPFDEECIMSSNETVTKFIEADTTLLCNNFVRDVAYHIYYKTSSTGIEIISAVNASVTLTDVPFSSATATAVMQSYSVTFSSINPDSKTAENGNVNFR